MNKTTKLKRAAHLLPLIVGTVSLVASFIMTAASAYSHSRLMYFLPLLLWLALFKASASSYRLYISGRDPMRYLVMVRLARNVMLAVIFFNLPYFHLQ